ncbi:MAG TPA: lysophospholipid acyltransferase family protein [Candidatus Polarisedimenticolia bacterium]
MRRILIGAVFVAATAFFATLAIAGCLVIPNGNPLIWCARPWASAILAACGTRVRITGRERIPVGRPVIYITNHQSHFDMLAIIRALPGQYRAIAKKELFRIPLFGWAIWIAGFIRIDREDRERAFRSLDVAAERIRRGRSVLIFAEGTRSLDGRLLPFKKGGFILAISSGCPIVPISISGSRAILARNTLDVRRGTIDVVIGEPIDVAPYSMEMRNELIARVRRAIESGFTELKALDGESAGETRSHQPAGGV